MPDDWPATSAVLVAGTGLAGGGDGRFARTARLLAGRIGQRGKFCRFAVSHGQLSRRPGRRGRRPRLIDFLDLIPPFLATARYLAICRRARSCGRQWPDIEAAATGLCLGPLGFLVGDHLPVGLAQHQRGAGRRTERRTQRAGRYQQNPDRDSSTSRCRLSHGSGGQGCAGRRSGR